MPLARKVLATVLACSTTLAPSLPADRPPSGLSGDPALAALIEEALRANPDVLAAQAQLDAALARPAQARGLANPMISTLYTNEGWSPSFGEAEDTTLGFMVSQDLPYPGKRRLRADIAQEEAAQAAQRFERVKLGVAAAVARAYYDLLLARDVLELVREQEEIWTQIVEIARTRYVVGEGAQQDVVRVQIEVTRIEQLRAEQKVEIDVRLAELNRLLARPASSPLATEAPLELHAVEETLEGAVLRLRDTSPELLAAERNIARAELQVDLVRREYRPDFSVAAGYMDRGSLDPMWQAGVGVSVPLYRRKLQGAVAQTEAELVAGQRDREAIELQLRLRTQQRLARLATTQRIAELYDQGIVPQDRTSIDAALANYQTGRVPFIAVLEALATLYNDRAAHLGLLATHAKLRASLEEASLEDDAAMGGGGVATMPTLGGRGLGITAGGGMSAGRSTM